MFSHFQVKLNGSDKWQAVGHLPGAILVQTGELLAAWTADLIPALVSFSAFKCSSRYVRTLCMSNPFEFLILL